jgi:hypothetical protein
MDMGLEEDAKKVANKYKRAFSWRMNEGSTTKAAVGAFVRIPTTDYPDILEDYLSISRRRKNNPTAMAQLQMHILHDAAVQEKAIKHYKAQVPAGTEGQNFIDEQVFMHRLIANAFRVIGDGIAWRAFGYDRSVPRVLSQNAVNQIIVSDGLIAEMDVWSAAYSDADAFPILNCITNCLAIGDITITYDDASVEIVEVKAGKTKSRRKVRQKQRLKDAVELLNGYGTLEEKFVSINTAPITPQNNLGELEKLLDQAEKQGWSAALIAPHCYIECLDMSRVRDMPNVLLNFQKMRAEQTSHWDEALTLKMNSMDLLEFTPNVAPFSIFPFSDKTCIELVIGKKSFTSYLNVGAVIQHFLRAGWTIEKQMQEALEETGNSAALMLKKGGFYCHLPPGDFVRLHVELLKPESMLAECEYIRGLGRQHKSEYGYWLYEGEASQWK